MLTGGESAEATLIAAHPAVREPTRHRPAKSSSSPRSSLSDDTFSSSSSSSSPHSPPSCSVAVLALTEHWRWKVGFLSQKLAAENNVTANYRKKVYCPWQIEWFLTSRHASVSGKWPPSVLARIRRPTLACAWGLNRQLIFFFPSLLIRRFCCWKGLLPRSLLLFLSCRCNC